MIVAPAGDALPRTVISRTYAPIRPAGTTPVTPTSGTSPLPRPVAPVAVLPTTHPVTALPQPAVPPSSVSVVSPIVAVPVLQNIGPPLSPGALQSITQPTITPDQIATQYGAYQEPQPYTNTLPVVSIPAATDVGNPSAPPVTEFGLTQNTWLLILIFAAVLLFLVSK